MRLPTPLATAGRRLGWAASLACALAWSGAVAEAQQGPGGAGDRSQAVRRVFSEFDRSDSPGCVVGVGQRGAILYRDGFGMADLEHDIPLSAFSISEIGSVSKQFTAAALVLLQQDGVLSLDDEVRKHYPAFPDFGRPITIRHLLNHTSGLRDQFVLLDLAGRPNGEVVSTVDEVVDLALRQRTLNFPPNTDYLYSNTGFTFMNRLVEHLTGKTFVEFTNERIFRPLGMTSTQWRDDYTRVVRGRANAYQPNGRGGFSLQMPFSNLHGSGAILTTVEDMIRWTEAVHADRVGKPGFRDEMLRTARLNDGRQLTYALGLRVDEYRGVREVSHGGSTAGYRAFLTHFPEQGLTVSVNCNLASVNADALAHGVAEVFLGDALGPLPAPPAAFALPAAELGRRAGLYHNPVTHQVVRLAAQGGRLVGGGLTLVPTGQDRFESLGSRMTFTYAAASQGRPARLTGASEDGAQVLEAREPASVGEAGLRALAGSYRNDETGSTLRLTFADGNLVLTYPPTTRVVLESAFADAFVGGGRTLIFQRDGSGAVTGFAYHAGRGRNIQFVRQP